MSLEHSPSRQKRGARPLFEPDRMYSAEEIRAKLGGKLHIVTIWKWCKQGRLGKRYEIGANSTRFRGAELNENLLGE